MKMRIIEALIAFSKPEILQHPNSMFNILIEELGMNATQIHNTSKGLLQKILHNYAAFEVSTIDRFTQKLIRAFAHDLKLPINFEVELDTKVLLNKAVDRLISKAGKDSNLTKILIDYAVEKADEDKSWDIALDLQKAAQMLTRENDASFLESISQRTLEEFSQFKQTIKSDIQQLESQLKLVANEVIETIESAGINDKDFFKSQIPKHFRAIGANKLENKFEAKWHQDISNTPFYTKKVAPEISLQIDALKPMIIDAYQLTKKAMFQLRLCKNMYKNITPLSVVRLIYNELQQLKEENNLLLISEFNTIVSEQIKDQPTPFIYERIGERFAHFFIDEFQDTSKLQWQNLRPLLSNALAYDTGSLMLVGDAKQAIYRWRGGQAEQFISLINNDADFQPKPKVLNLPTNYRSSRAVVDFNNQFFQHLSTTVFSDQVHSQLYTNSKQDTADENHGFVQATFLEFENGEDKAQRYANHVLERVKSYKTDQNAYSDICVLVRKRKEGVAVAKVLSENGVKIISSETLLLSSSPEVNFIVNLLCFIQTPSDLEAKLQVINFLLTHIVNEEHHHQFRTTMLKLDSEAFFKTLTSKGVNFNNETVLRLPLYEAIEYIISGFGMATTTNAYLQFFLDVAFDFTQKHLASLGQFLIYFEEKKKSLSIVSPEGVDAVQIMTVHKSKGLEFPVVIFPFADLNIYKEIDPMEWIPLDKHSHPFTHFLVNYNKTLKQLGGLTEQLYDTRQSQLELDNINLLYVALTRAANQLYIVGDATPLKGGRDNLKTYSGLLINFFKTIGKWDENSKQAQFGTLQKIKHRKTSKYPTRIQHDTSSTPKSQLALSIVTNSGYLWETQQKEAIERGNLVHLLLSKIKTIDDIGVVLDHFMALGTINSFQFSSLKKTLLDVVKHPILKPYYQHSVQVYNEKSIMSSSGQIIIPDRLVVLEDQSAVIIDYKTGEPHNSHIQQLENYAKIVSDMGLQVDKRIVVYINASIEVKQF